MPIPRAACTVALLLLASTTALAELQNVQVGGGPRRDIITAPPVGWETRITPGFDPPIEYFVVYGAPRRDEKLNQSATAAAWGPKGFDVLKALFEDPAWANYRFQTFELMRMCDRDRFKTFCAAEAERQLSSTEVDAAAYGIEVLLDSVARFDYPAFLKLADAHRSATRTRDLNAIANVLLRQCEGAHAAECEQRLRTILNETQDPGVKLTIQRAFDERAGRARAQEPLQKTNGSEQEKRQ